MSINVADDTPLTTVYAFEAQLAADPRIASVTFVTALPSVPVTVP